MVTDVRRRLDLAAQPVYQVGMMFLCILTMLLLALELRDLDPQSRLILHYVDLGLCSLFFVDFLLCLYSAPSRWRYLYRWGWLDLLSCVPTIAMARWARVVRLIRLVRVIRVLSKVIAHSRKTFMISSAVMAVLSAIVLASVFVLEFEHGAEGANIKTAVDAVWWATVTITTVGYGDRFPVTVAGRLVAVGLMFVGVVLFSIFSGLLASIFIAQDVNARQDAELDNLRKEIERLRHAS